MPVSREKAKSISRRENSENSDSRRQPFSPDSRYAAEPSAQSLTSNGHSFIILTRTTRRVKEAEVCLTGQRENQ